MEHYGDAYCKSNARVHELISVPGIRPPVNSIFLFDQRPQLPGFKGIMAWAMAPHGKNTGKQPRARTPSRPQSVLPSPPATQDILERAVLAYVDGASSSLPPADTLAAPPTLLLTADDAANSPALASPSLYLSEPRDLWRPAGFMPCPDTRGQPF